MSNGPIRSFLNVGTTCDGVVSRRAFLKQMSVAGAAGAAMSVGWQDMLVAQASELRKLGRSMILLWMDGGPSQFETFNPKVGSPNQGPAKAIKTKLPGVHFAEFWPRTAKVADRMAIIRSMRTNEADHFRAIKLTRTGYPINPTLAYPTWGSVVAHELEEPSVELPAFVRVGKPRIQTRDVNAGVLGPRYEAFRVDDPTKIPDDLLPTTTADRVRRRLSLTDRLDQAYADRGAKRAVSEKKAIYDRTSRFVLSSKTEVFDLEKEPKWLRDQYGHTSFGQGCLLARRLVESGVTFVEVFSTGGRNDAGWDTHGNGFRDTPNLCAESDAGYSTLLLDLEARGMLENTLVVWMGEFGRTPKIKKDGGRDHYSKGWLACLSGAGVKQGQVIGATDKDGKDVTDRPVGINELYGSFCHAMGMNADHEYVVGGQQPIRLVKGAQVVPELF